ncbi:MAG: glycosyltransferase family 2 protein, partial [Vulcanibacillus sp.]
MSKTALVILTLNPSAYIKSIINALEHLATKTDSILVIDSDSDDGSLFYSEILSFDVHKISRQYFNHGATRQLALTLCPDADILIYMTQDAFLATPNAIKNILAPFEDEKVGAVCGRQLPHTDATPIAAHARLFNYPAVSSVKEKTDIPRIGIKAAFLSNSFAAYRRTALMDVGGFPSDVILSEDTYVAAKMLQAGWKLAYAAEATCYHSHNYSMKEEFERYFDIGVFHSREKWFIESLGKAEGEGKRFVLSEQKYLLKHATWLIPSAILRTGLKLIGYKLG